MSNPYSTVLFDLGNTLVYDNVSGWPRAYARAEKALWKVLRQEGLGIDPAQLYGGPGTLLSHYYEHRGQGVEELGTLRFLANLFRTQSIDVSELTVQRALRAMYRETQRNWHRERDAASTLRLLRGRGIRLGAVSNVSDEQNALELLDRAQLRRYFELILTSAAHGRRKPDPSIFQAALAQMDSQPRQTVMVGDSYDADILGASRLGLFTIWITKHASSPPPSDATRAGAIVTSLREVPTVLS